MAGFHEACPSPPASVALTASTRAACTSRQRPARGPCPARDRRKMCCSSRTEDAGADGGAGCSRRKSKEQRGEVVYRPSAAPAPLQRSANCRAQRGRSCEQGASEGGGFSLIGSPFFSGNKVCHRKSALASARCAKSSGATASVHLFWRPKVTQLSRGALLWLKLGSVTDPTPTRPRPTRRRHPDPH